MVDLDLIGEPFEERATQALSSHRTAMHLLDLREGIEMIPEGEAGDAHHCHNGNCLDPHIWLSPRRVQQQAKAIAQTLIELYPENKEFYEKNLETTLKKLDTLDLDLQKTLAPLRGKKILVSHPAFGYLAADYGFTQIPFEQEGKDPTPQRLTQLLKTAKSSGARTIFVQAQHTAGKGINLIANELGMQVEELDPLAENYFKNMRTMAERLATQSQKQTRSSTQ